MLLRTLSKWVWVSFTIALGVGMFTLGCGDDPAPVSDPTPTHVSSRVAHARGIYSNCGPFANPPEVRGIIESDYTPDILAWTQDGNRIIFDNPRVHSAFGGWRDDANGWDIHFLDVGGGYLHRIVDANPEYLPHHGVYADVSPDGSRIVYASCEYPSARELYHTVVFHTGEEWSAYDDLFERERYNYEIVIRKIDGTDPRRLTENIVMDHYPVWSPDGSRIAFARTARGRGIPDGVPVGIVVAAADGSDRRTITDQWASSISWSPDGQRLAFLQVEGYVYIVGADGSNLTQLSGGGMVTEAPVWSPDGSLVAFGRSSEHISDIVISSPDGSDQRAIVGLKGISLWTSDGSDVRFSPIPESTDSGEQRVTADLVASSIAWSADGSEIRFVGAPESMQSDDAAPAYAGIFSVAVDGSDMRIIADIEWPSLVSWSPDGSRVAVRIAPTTFSRDDKIVVPEVVLYTLASDGSDKRILARRTPIGKLAAESEWKNVGVCSEGYVVPDPQDNPGLVRDCEALLRIRDALAGDAALNWSFDVPITEWQGLDFYPFFSSPSFPRRVRGLHLHGEDSGHPRLTGILPGELGDLEELEMVIITHQSLAGEIPSELGNLSNLRSLDLSNNGLTGEIPSELGRLRNLRGLDLSNNDLTGRIPLALGRIGKDLHLFVRDNPDLTGSIPLGLWYFAEDLDIRGTSLMPPPGKVCTDADFARRQCRTE